MLLAVTMHCYFYTMKITHFAFSQCVSNILLGYHLNSMDKALYFTAENDIKLVVIIKTIKGYKLPLK